MNHDNGYKLLFSHAEMVADLLRGFVHEDAGTGQPQPRIHSVGRKSIDAGAPTRCRDSPFA